MKYQFKTNINCDGCIARVTPHLNEVKEIQNWAVDTANPSKILTVETDSLDEKQVMKVVEKAGFIAKVLVEN